MQFDEAPKSAAPVPALSIGALPAPNARPLPGGRRLLAACGLAALVALLWAPFGLNVGPDTDTLNIHANPELYPWVSPVLLRPFVFAPYRLAAWLFPESFVGYNLLVALAVFGKGLVLFLLLDRVQPGRPALALLTGALFAIYPAGIFTYRANMVAYQFAVLCFLAAVYCLVLHWERPRPAALLGMLAALLLALGIVETLLPVALLAPCVLVWKSGWSRRLIGVAALWLALPALLAGYLGYGLLNQASVVGYQSARIRLPQRGLAAALGDSFVHVCWQHFWAGYRRGLTALDNSQGTAWSHIGLALVAALLLGGVAWVLQASSDQRAVPSTYRRCILTLAGGVATAWAGYLPYFPTNLRFGTYRTFFFSAIGAALATGAALKLLGRGASAVVRVRRDSALIVAGAILVGLAMLSALADLGGWDRYSRDEQELVSAVARRLPAVRRDTLIVLLETKGARFKHKYHVWFYQNALRLAYGDRNIHVSLCYRNVKPRDTERPSCEFTAHGLRIRNATGLAQATWPYARTIVLLLQRDGQPELLTRIPGPGEWSATYAPESLFDPTAPLPRHLFTYLKYAGVRAPNGP